MDAGGQGGVNGCTGPGRGEWMQGGGERGMDTGGRGGGNGCRGIPKAGAHTMQGDAWKQKWEIKWSMAWV